MEKTVFDMKDVPSDVRRMGARRARLSVTEVQHRMRMDALREIGDMAREESSEDVSNWVDEEAAYTEEGMVMAAVDLKTLDELHKSGELDDDAYEDLEEWLSQDIERVYRDYRDVCEAVRLVDRHMDLNLLPRMEAVFKREEDSKLPIPIDVVQRNLENMPQFGEMSL